MDFLVPVRVGDLVILRSSVNRVFHTSMEIGVKVWVENYRSGQNRHVSSAYLTFVAIDEAGNKLAVPQVIPETEDEKRRYEDALRRREIRRAECGAPERRMELDFGWPEVGRLQRSEVRLQSVKPWAFHFCNLTLVTG